MGSWGLRFFVDLFTMAVNEESMTERADDSSFHSNNDCCPLCGGADCKTVKNQNRPGVIYRQCTTCDLIAMSPRFFLNSDSERERYLKHQNTSEDLGYLQHLQPILDLILSEYPEGGRAQLNGLDFGSGPEPVLKNLLEKNQIKMAGYDPFFSPEASVLERSYDFIVSTEVVEHFFNPADEFKTMNSLLKPGGSLFILTQLHANDIADDSKSRFSFAKWWYPKDATHVSFYSEKTFRWIARQFGFQISCDQKSLVCLRKDTL